MRPAPPVRARQLSWPLRDPTRLAQRRIRWYAERILVSTLLAGHNVGLEEIDHGLVNVYFDPVWLGHFFERKRCILDSSDSRRNSRATIGGQLEMDSELRRRSVDSRRAIRQRTSPQA